MTILRCLITLMLLGSSSLPAQSEPPVGLWGSESVFGSPLRGTLTVTRSGSDWHARITSVETRFTLKGDSVRFAFPGELGAFRGALTADRRRIHGFWVQPKDQPSPIAGDPGGLDQPFAHRLTLVLGQPDTWSGEVVPLESRYTLFLAIWRAANGNFVAAFRNPELNHRGGNSTF